MSNARNLRITLTLIATAIVVSIVPAGAQATVCNQASEAQRGDLVAADTSAPRPPVRHTTNLAAVPGKGGGIATAAERSPALNGCVVPSGGDSGGGGVILTGGDGGGDILIGGDIAN